MAKTVDSEVRILGKDHTGKAFASAGAGLAKLAASMRALNSSAGLNRLHGSFTRITGALRNVAHFAGVAMGALTALTGIGVIGGVAGLAAVLKNAGDHLGDLSDMSNKIGMPVQKLREFKLLAEQQGVSWQSASAGLVAASRGFAQMRTHTGRLYTLLRKTNPALEKQIEQSRSASEAFDIMMGAVANAKDEAEAIRLSQLFFGTDDFAMVAKLKGQELQDFLKDARRILGYISDETAAATEGYGDTVNRIKAALYSYAEDLAGKILPRMSDLNTKFGSWLADNREWVDLAIATKFDEMVQYLQQVDWAKIGESMRVMGEAGLTIAKGIRDFAVELSKIPDEAQPIIEFVKTVDGYFKAWDAFWRERGGISGMIMNNWEKVKPAIDSARAAAGLPKNGLEGLRAPGASFPPLDFSRPDMGRPRPGGNFPGRPGRPGGNGSRWNMGVDPNRGVLGDQVAPWPTGKGPAWTDPSFGVLDSRKRVDNLTQSMTSLTREVADLTDVLKGGGGSNAMSGYGGNDLASPIFAGGASGLSGVAQAFGLGGGGMGGPRAGSAAGGARAAAGGPMGARTGGSRSWRNRNPGNLRYSPATVAMGAVGRDDKGFAVFPDEASGKKAMESLLFNDPRYAGLSIDQAIGKYAPSNENDTGLYSRTVAGALGLPGNTPMASLSTAQRQTMLAAMQKHEGWTPGTETSGVGIPNLTGAGLSGQVQRGSANFMHGQFGAPGTNLTTITSPNGAKWTVNKAAAPNFAGFIRDLEASGYKASSSGGYAMRAKRGGKSLSQHAYGNAIDINAARNPFQANDGSMVTDMPPGVSDLAAKWGLSWGGDWKGKRKDPMHFEWTGAKEAAVADMLQGRGGQGPHLGKGELTVKIKPAAGTDVVGVQSKPMDRITTNVGVDRTGDRLYKPGVGAGMVGHI